MTELLKQALETIKALKRYCESADPGLEIGATVIAKLEKAIEQADQPEPRQWIELTDEEVINVMPDDVTPISLGEAFFKFAKLIEAKLKENNNA
jgi:hypothetical protein